MRFCQELNAFGLVDSASAWLQKDMLSPFLLMSEHHMTFLHRATYKVFCLKFSERGFYGCWSLKFPYNFPAALSWKASATKGKPPHFKKKPSRNLSSKSKLLPCPQGRDGLSTRQLTPVSGQPSAVDCSSMFHCNVRFWGVWLPTAAHRSSAYILLACVCSRRVL